MKNGCPQIVQVINCSTSGRNEADQFGEVTVNEDDFVEDEENLEDEDGIVPNEETKENNRYNLGYSSTASIYRNLRSSTYPHR